MEYGSQVLFLITIGYIASGMLYTSPSTEHNVKSGIVGVALVFLAQSSLKPYRTPFSMVRDSVCRVGARIGLLYLGILVFLLFQDAEFARGLFAYIDPALNVELPLRNENYTRDCSLTVANVLRVSDFYVLVHLLNWYLAALILRDYYMLHI